MPKLSTSTYYYIGAALGRRTKNPNIYLAWRPHSIHILANPVLATTAKAAAPAAAATVSRRRRLLLQQPNPFLSLSQSGKLSKRLWCPYLTRCTHSLTNHSGRVWYSEELGLESLPCHHSTTRAFAITAIASWGSRQELPPLWCDGGGGGSAVATPNFRTCCLWHGRPLDDCG